MSEVSDAAVHNMKMTPFGCEIEMSGISRKNAAVLAARHFATGRYEYTAARNGYGSWSAWDQAGREWKFERDSSISGDPEEACEMVTPVLRYDEDIGILMALVRIMRHHGARSSGSLKCGVHVHISGDGHTAATIINLINLMAAHEQQLIQAVCIDDYRLDRYCRTVDPEFIERIRERKPRTMEELQWCWYDGPAHEGRYSSTRYHMLNLHCLFTGNHTVEFRLFQFDEPTGERRGGLHAGQLRAMILLCLALDNEARHRRYILPRPQQTDNEAFALRTFLVRIGFIGPEFREPRRYFMRNVAGNSAWRFK